MRPSDVSVIRARPSQIVVADELEAVRTYIRSELSPATRRAYLSDFRIFTAWCDARGAAAVPADPRSVALFMASEAKSGLHASTLTRRLAAIRYAHRAQGHEAPTSSEVVASTMRGIRREIGTATTKKAPATAARVAAMVEQIPTSLTGKRDRALLLLGFACALRRSELVALEVSDIEHVAEGAIVTIRRSKTDQEGRGETIPIPAGGRLRVIPALLDWLNAAGIAKGPIFRPINRHGQVMPPALTPTSVANIVKAHAGAAGLDPDTFSGHSLRRGFLTSAANSGATLAKMKRISRHRSTDILMGYVEDAEQFKDHAGEAFL